MDAILADNTFKRISLNENDKIPIQISLEFIPRYQLTISQHWFSNGLALNRRQAIIWANADPTHLCISSSLWVNMPNPSKAMARKYPFTQCVPAKQWISVESIAWPSHSENFMWKSMLVRALGGLKLKSPRLMKIQWSLVKFYLNGCQKLEHL